MIHLKMTMKVSSLSKCIHSKWVLLNLSNFTDYKRHYLTNSYRVCDPLTDTSSVNGCCISSQCIVKAFGRVQNGKSRFY